jgi:hypothetical protein
VQGFPVFQIPNLESLQFGKSNSGLSYSELPKMMTQNDDCGPFENGQKWVFSELQG